jgi:hypothetical protein
VVDCLRRVKQMTTSEREEEHKEQEEDRFQQIAKELAQL